MKKFIALLLLIILLPMQTHAATTQPPEVKGDPMEGQVLVFNPAIDSVKTCGNRMTVNVTTTSTAYMYVVQTSDRADFKDAQSYYYRGKDWQKGCVGVWLNENFGDNNVRIIWYDGKPISYRAVKAPQRLTMPLKLARQIESRYQIKKSFTVPKSRYLRVRVIYNGGGTRQYSQWATGKAR